MHACECDHAGEGKDKSLRPGHLPALAPQIQSEAYPDEGDDKHAAVPEHGGARRTEHGDEEVEPGKVLPMHDAEDGKRKRQHASREHYVLHHVRQVKVGHKETDAQNDVRGPHAPRAIHATHHANAVGINGDPDDRLHAVHEEGRIDHLAAKPHEHEEAYAVPVAPLPEVRLVPNVDDVVLHVDAGIDRQYTRDGDNRDDRGAGGLTQRGKRGARGPLGARAGKGPQQNVANHIEARHDYCGEQQRAAPHKDDRGMPEPRKQRGHDLEWGQLKDEHKGEED